MQTAEILLFSFYALDCAVLAPVSRAAYLAVRFDFVLVRSLAFKLRFLERCGLDRADRRPFLGVSVVSHHSVTVRARNSVPVEPYRARRSRGRFYRGLCGLRGGRHRVGSLAPVGLAVLLRVSLDLVFVSRARLQTRLLEAEGGRRDRRRRAPLFGLCVICIHAVARRAVDLSQLIFTALSVQVNLVVFTLSTVISSMP